MHPKKLLFPVALPLAIACALSACSKVEDMHDATMNMNGKTTQLAGTSERMHDVMTEVFDSGRQGAALDLRNKNFELLLDSKKLEDKGLYAGLYFMSFEFQLWTKLGVDGTKGEREVLMRDAADEFIRRLVGISHWDGVDPFAGKNPLAFGAAENERAVFNALAASVDRNNRKQTAVTAREGLEEISMLKMIETSLRAGKEIKEGRARLDDYPEYVDSILAREELARRLIEARYQALGLMVLGQLTPITKNITEGIKFKILGLPWTLNFANLNQSQLRVATYRLKEAARAKALLAELGVDVQLDVNILNIFRNATVVGVDDLARGRAKNPASEDAAKAAEDFLGAAETYLGAPLK